MGEKRRRKTIGEEMGLKPLEPVVVKFFWPRELLEAFRDDPEAVGAVRAVSKAGAADRLQCLICGDRVEFPGIVVVGRSASCGPVGFVAVACSSCADSDTIRDDVVAAMGETEIETSSAPS